MLDQFMGTCDLIQPDNLGDVESLPPRLKCPVDVASGFEFRIHWHIVAADEEQSGVHETSCQTGVSGIGTFVA